MMTEEQSKHIVLQTCNKMQPNHLRTGYNKFKKFVLETIKTTYVSNPYDIYKTDEERINAIHNSGCITKRKDPITNQACLLRFNEHADHFNESWNVVFNSFKDTQYTSAPATETAVTTQEVKLPSSTQTILLTCTSAELENIYNDLMKAQQMDTEIAKLQTERAKLTYETMQRIDALRPSSSKKCN